MSTCDFGRCDPCSLPTTPNLPTEIDGITVEQFLVKFPEFKPMLTDTELSEDFLQAQLDLSKLEIEVGAWPQVIQSESVYLLTADHLQTRFEQQSATASLAVQASKGMPSKPLEQPSVTSYAEKLRLLRQQSRSTGGMIV